MSQKSLFRFQIISIMVCFYVMGAIEMVGIASNYVKQHLNLNDTQANLLPSLVYIWFFVCTIPVGMVIKRIGERKTVLVSMAVMLVAMILPLFKTSYIAMIISFIVLGIGNVSLQTSLYPLLESNITGKVLARHLTIGQFVKTFSSFSAPYVAMLGALYFMHFLGLGWRVLFLFYLVVIGFSIFLIVVSGAKAQVHNEQVFTFKQCLRLARNRLVLLSVIGVMCHVGIDISTNTLAPKLLINRLGIALEWASFASSVYFIARLVGCFFWAVYLNKVSKRFFFYLSIILMFIAVIGLYWAHNTFLLYSCIALIGFGNANLFPVFYSEAILSNPEQKSAMSVLMIMSQCGGAFFTLAMGIFTDLVGMKGAITVLLVGVVYLLFYSFTLRKEIRSIGA
ncbi:MAG: MFS transporter [Marinifilaceae bacterium]